MVNRVTGAILGLAVADAMGVPVEFKSRDELKKNPVREMQGYGTYNQPPGTWSDDTSMTLCLMDSLLHGLDYEDIMNHFMEWFHENKYTPFGVMFDMGNATREALQKYELGLFPLECGGNSEYDNGNGSLMRILPLAFYIYGAYGEDCETETICKLAHQVSSLTHRHMRSKIACGIYVLIAIEILSRADLKQAISRGMNKANEYYMTNPLTQDEFMKYQRVSTDVLTILSESDIKSTGYVVDTLEAALWCLLKTETYKDCVLLAVNLGDDTDTVAAVAGGLAGLYYGMDAIPKEWLTCLARKNDIINLCKKFSQVL